MSQWSTLQFRCGGLVSTAVNDFWQLGLTVQDPSVPNFPLLTPSSGPHTWNVSVGMTSAASLSDGRVAAMPEAMAASAASGLTQNETEVLTRLLTMSGTSGLTQNELLGIIRTITMSAASGMTITQIATMPEAAILSIATGLSTNEISIIVRTVILSIFSTLGTEGEVIKPFVSGEMALELSPVMIEVAVLTILRSLTLSATTGLAETKTVGIPKNATFASAPELNLNETEILARAFSLMGTTEITESSLMHINKIAFLAGVTEFTTGELTILSKALALSSATGLSLSAIHACCAHQEFMGITGFTTSFLSYMNKILPLTGITGITLSNLMVIEEAISFVINSGLPLEETEILIKTLILSATSGMPVSELKLINKALALGSITNQTQSFLGIISKSISETMESSLSADSTNQVKANTVVSLGNVSVRGFNLSTWINSLESFLLGSHADISVYGRVPGMIPCIWDNVATSYFRFNYYVHPGKRPSILDKKVIRRRRQFNPATGVYTTIEYYRDGTNSETKSDLSAAEEYRKVMTIQDRGEDPFD